MSLLEDAQEDGPLAGTLAMRKAQVTILTRVQIPLLVTAVVMFTAAGWWPLAAALPVLWLGILVHVRITQGCWGCGWRELLLVAAALWVVWLSSSSIAGWGA